MNEVNPEQDKQSSLAFILIFLVTVTSLLYLAELYNYLLFHMLAELFAICIGFFIFIIVWNTRKNIDAGYLIFIGIGSLFIGLIDFLHALAYKGMPIFKGYNTDLPTQLWIAARYMQAGTLFLIPFCRRKITRFWRLIAGYAVSFLFLMFLIFARWFPQCYNEVSGLTLFKKVSEYIICFILLVTFILLVINHRWIDSYMYKMLVCSLILTIAAELVFTLYTGVYGIFNFLGHVFKFMAFFLLYEGIAVIALKRPEYILYRNLQMQKEELKAALENIRTLKGLLPICASCKKIRDDHGYWDQVENYIMSHSDAVFTHGLCPDCMQKFFAEHKIAQDSPVTHPPDV